MLAEMFQPFSQQYSRFINADYGYYKIRRDNLEKAY